MTREMCTPIRISILDSIDEGLSIRQIARSVSVSHVAILKHVKILEKEHYISRIYRSSKVQYAILPLGREALEKRLPPRDHEVMEKVTTREPREPSDMKIRLHRLQIKFDLVSRIEDPSVITFRDFPSKIVPLEHWQKNIIQFEDFTAILSQKSLIITGVQRYLKAAEDVEVQEADVMSMIMPFAEQIEDKIRRLHPGFALKRADPLALDVDILNRDKDDQFILGLIREGITETSKILEVTTRERNLSVSDVRERLSILAKDGILKKRESMAGFRLKRIDRGTLVGHIITRELAFEHHPIAEKVKHMRINNEEGNPRIIVDQSKGFPELETVDKKTATEDMEMLRRNTLTLATSDLSIALQALNQQISVSTELAKHANTAQDQMDQVIASLGKLTQAIGAIIGIGGK